jgi:restriction system protein
MSPLDYERMCADILTADGWHARITKASGDQGVDVVADRNGVRIVLQCKLYSSPVGNSAVQEVFAGKVHEEAQYAAVVTNAGYTVGARQIANKTQVALLHHDDLKAWCHSCLSIA